VRDTSTVLTVKSCYLTYYKKKGCKSVIFYHNNVPIIDVNQTFASLGITDSDVLAAMENGRKFVRN
jgi:hypothetical protein